MTYTNNHQIEKKADEVRARFGEVSYGIDDVFSILNMLDIEYIRYPFESEKPLGFCTRYKGKNIIVTNSTNILSREIFTVAHELGHILFDFSDEDIMIVDYDMQGEDKSAREKRAFYFANCLLMPEDKLKKYIKYELEHSETFLDALDIVRMQSEFNVSYSALVWRLLKTGIIKESQKDDLLHQQVKYKSHVLFDLLNIDKRLLESYGKIQIPKKYINYVYSNYEDKIIPESSFEKAMTIMGYTKENIEAFKKMTQETTE